MNDPPSHVISVRAIEDIMQIQRLIEESPNFKSFQMGKNKSEERIVFSVLKHDVYSTDTTANHLSCMVKECDIENSFKCTDKTCKRLERPGWEGDCGFTKFVNPDSVVVLENFGLIENANSEAEMKCWSSDSDITVLRVRKEYRNELSNKVEWEEQRNLEDDISLSSVNLDWESHSLINLAGVASKEKDIRETITPFTIWSKSKNDTRNSSMMFIENLNSNQPSTPAVQLTVESDKQEIKSEENKEAHKKSILPKKKKKIIKKLFGCIMRKKSPR